MDISIVLAVYNEELCVSKELQIIKETMDKTCYNYEIIVVNDGSIDKSKTILMSNPYIKLVNNSTNKGSGEARRIGTKLAQGKFVVWTDVDMTYPNNEIPLLIKELIDKEYDQIIGFRNSEEGELKYLRFFVKWLIRRISCVLAGKRILDLNSGLRIVKRDIVELYLDLLPQGFSCTSTLTLAFVYNDYSVGYYPIKYSARVGKSKFKPIIDTYRCIKQIIRINRYFKKQNRCLTVNKS